MAGEDSLVDREFIGKVLPNKDTMHQGKYKVNVPELQPHMKETDGIWCKNHTHKWRISPSQNGICGSYYPLQPGMSVIVKFFANHIESAYVDRIISDAYSETLPYEIIERDEYYQIIRTPKHNNLIAIYEGDKGSTNVPKNSIHIYYNDTRTVVVIDEDGVHIITADNVDIKSAKNIKIEATKDIDIKSGGKINIEAVGDINIKSGAKIKTESVADTDIKSGAKIKTEAVADISTKSSTKILLESNVGIGIKSAGVNFIEGRMNHLKGFNIGIIPTGFSSAAPPAVAADSADAANPVVIPDIITDSDYEYFKRSSGG